MVSGMPESGERSRLATSSRYEEPAVTHDQAQSLGRGRMRRLAILGGPSTRFMAGRRAFPLYGVLHHIGRRTGREYASPVVVRGGDDAVFVPLPFGDGTDWYRNALAAGGLRVTWKGQGRWLANPVIVEREAAAAGFNRIMRALMRFARIRQVVRFDGLEEHPPT
jgi:deazaflavin-dependent oxidoreductase (nitroreductase family)